MGFSRDQKIILTGVFGTGVLLGSAVTYYFSQGSSVKKAEPGRSQFAPPIAELKDNELAFLKVNEDRSAPFPVTKLGTYSYSTFEKETGKYQVNIIVPGYPRWWAPPENEAQQLACDTGDFYINENGARSAYPLNPIMLSVSKETFDLSKAFVICDRNCMRHIHDFVRALQGSSVYDRSFIGFSMVDDILCFIRLGKRIGAPDHGGFGHGFENRFTTKDNSNIPPETEEVSGFWGIHRLEVDGKIFVVRAEADCLVKESGPMPPKPFSDDVVRINHRRRLSDDGIMDKEDRGSDISGSLFVELKTKSKYFLDKFDYEGLYFQMLMGGVSLAYLCVHDKGMVDEVRRIDIKDFDDSSNPLGSIGPLVRGRLVLVSKLIGNIKKKIKDHLVKHPEDNHGKIGLRKGVVAIYPGDPTKKEKDVFNVDQI